MPLPKGTRYRYKKGTNVRLAFAKGTSKVIEAKNMKTGDVAKAIGKAKPKV
jgi:hypothetical protein